MGSSSTATCSTGQTRTAVRIRDGFLSAATTRLATTPIKRAPTPATVLWRSGKTEKWPRLVIGSLLRLASLLPSDMLPSRNPRLWLGCAAAFALAILLRLVALDSDPFAGLDWRVRWLRGLVDRKSH